MLLLYQNFVSLLLFFPSVHLETELCRDPSPALSAPWVLGDAVLPTRLCLQPWATLVLLVLTCHGL